MSDSQFEPEIATEEILDEGILDGCSEYIFESLLVLSFLVLSFGGIYKAFKVYYFGEVKRGYVVSKERKRIDTTYDGPVYEYYVHIDVLKRPLELSNYEDIPEKDTIDFHIYNDNPEFFIYTGGKQRSLSSFLDACLDTYQSTALIIFVSIFSLIEIVLLIRVMRNARFKIYGNSDHARMNMFLLFSIHGLVLIAGVGVAIFLGKTAFLYLLNEFNLGLISSGICFLIATLFLFSSPVLTHKFFFLFHNRNTEWVKAIGYLILIFALINFIVGVIVALVNDNPDDFTPQGILSLLRSFWGMAVG